MIDFQFVRLESDPPPAPIHRGSADAQGGPVVDFYEPGQPPVKEGCVAVDGALVKEIRKNPAGFSENVHNSTAPAGAVRKQLGR